MRWGCVSAAPGWHTPAQLPLLHSDSRAGVRQPPRHPTRAASAALLRLGRFRSADFRGARPLLRAPALANRPPPVASLHGPRRRSSTGWRQLAALAALDVRSHCCGTVAAPDSCKGYAPPLHPPR